MPTENQVSLEIAQFLAKGPTPEQIIAFHPSQIATERAYELIATERAGNITKEEKDELDICVYLEHMMRLIKAEAHLLLQQHAS